MSHSIETHRLLYHFDKTNITTDFAEKAGNALLYPLRQFAGRSVKVVGDHYEAIPAIGKIHRVLLALGYLLLSPLTIPLTLIGLTVTAFSKTHVATYGGYRLFVEIIAKPKPTKKQNELTSPTTVEAFLRQTQDPAKITEAAKEASMHSLKMLVKAVSIEQLPAVLAGCDADKLAKVFEDCLRLSQSDPKEESKQIAQKKLCIVLKSLTPESIERIGRIDFLLDDLLFLTMWKEEPALPPLLLQKFTEKLREQVKRMYVFENTITSNFNDAQLAHLCRTCGDMADFTGWIAIARKNPEVFIKMLKAVFAEKVNAIQPALLEKALEKWTTTPFLDSEKLTSEQKTALQNLLIPSCQGCDLSALPPRVMNLFTKALPPAALAEFLTEKFVLDCFKGCREEKEEAHFTETPLIDRFVAAIWSLTDASKGCALLQALFKELSDAEFASYLSGYNRYGQLTPQRAAAIVLASSDLTHPKSLERLERVLSKLKDEQGLQYDTILAVTKTMFAAATPDQAVVLWRAIPKNGLPPCLRTDQLKSWVPQVPQIEAFVRQFSAKELEEILSLSTGFMRIDNKPFFDALIAELRTQNKMLDVLKAHVNTGSFSAHEIANESEMQALIAHYILSKDQTELASAAAQSTPLDRLFFGIGGKAWKRRDPQLHSSAKPGIDWPAATDSIGRYLQYAQSLEGSQANMPEAFQGVISAFNAHLKVDRWIDSKQPTDTIRIAKEKLLELLQQLKPETQQLIAQKLPITKANIMNPKDSLMVKPKLLELLLCVQKEENWLPKELSALFLKIEPEELAQAFLLMPDALQKAIVVEFKKDYLQSTSADVFDALKLLFDPLLKAFDAVLTPEEKQKYLSDFPPVSNNDEKDTEGYLT